MKKLLIGLLANAESHPKQTTAIAVALLVLIIVLAATARHWLLWVVGIIALVVWGISKCKKEQECKRREAEERERLRREWRTYIACNALCHSANALIGTLPGVFARMGIEDICGQYMFLRGIEQIHATVPKKPDALIDPAILKKCWQPKLNALLRTGRVEGVPCLSFDGKFPAICIDEVYDRGTYFEVFVVLADFPAATDYLMQRMFEVAGNNAPPPDVSPVDPQF